MADSLAYSKDLSYVDLQKCNLQNAFLGVKRIDDAKLNVSENDLILYKTDFFMADLSPLPLSTGKAPRCEKKQLDIGFLKISFFAIKRI